MNTSLVVLTDFFAVSNRALSYAADLAVPLHAQLVLLHVRHNGLLAPGEYGSSPTRPTRRRTTQALHELAESQPVPTTVEVSGNFLPEAVTTAVVHHQPLLLVLGRPGTASTPLEVVTDTAMDLMRHAPYPLLVVPTVGWDAFPPRRLLLAVDGQEFSLYKHRRVVPQLLMALGGILQVVHITDDAHARLMPDEVLATVRANGLSDGAPLPAASLHEVYNPRIVEGVLTAASDWEADMLVVVARRHSLLGGLFHRSVTAGLLAESPIPVLLLPAQD